MGIKTKCTCGAVLKANRKLAGKKVRCPKCKQPLDIPIPAQLQGQDAVGKENVNKLLPAQGSPESPASHALWDEVSKTLETNEKAKISEKAARTHRRFSRYAGNPQYRPIVQARPNVPYNAGWFPFDWSSMEMTIFFACIIATVASPFVFVSGCEKQRKERLLAQDTEVTQGVITNANKTRRYSSSRRWSRTSYVYEIRVSYNVNGVRYSTSQRVDRAFFDEYVPNGIPKEYPIAVEYAKADPSVAIVEGGRFESPVVANEVIVSGVLLAIAGVLGMCCLFFRDG